MSSNTNSQNPLLAYLLSEGLISEMEVRDLARTAGADCMPLGQILVRHKIISIQDLLKSLTYQDDHPDAPVGELCVRNGFCTQEQIDAALELQSRSAPHSLLVLLNAFGVSNGDLLRAIAEYVANLERHEISTKNEIEDLRAEVALLRRRLSERDAA